MQEEIEHKQKIFSFLSHCHKPNSLQHKVKRGRLASHGSNYTSDSKRSRRLFNTVRKRNAEGETPRPLGVGRRPLCKRPPLLPFKWRLHSSLSLQSWEKSGGEPQTFLCKGSFWKQHVPHWQVRLNSLKKTPPDENPAFRDRRGGNTVPS